MSKKKICKEFNAKKNMFFKEKNLVYKMVEYGENTEQVGKLLNMSSQAIRNKLKGRSDFSFDDVVILSNHFKVDLTYFLKK